MMDVMFTCPASTPLDPFVHLSREHWESLAQTTPLPLTDDDVAHLRALGDPIDLAEVDAIYRPLSAFIAMHAEVELDLHRRASEFIGVPARPTPFVIAIAGSVAVGKSSAARVLRELLARWPTLPRVDLVTTDGFLYPNEVLANRGIMARKGFPESYDRRSFIRFMRAIKSGEKRVEAPLYDHLAYDILPDEVQVVSCPDILIIEGLNVLQPARIGSSGQMSAVSDYFDLSIYVDADVADIERWYVERFLTLKNTAFHKPESYFQRYASLGEEEARQVARAIWRRVNAPNLLENIEPTRSRATVILRKGSDHRMESVYLRAG